MTDIAHSSGIQIFRQGYTWSQTENGDFIIFIEYITNTSKADYNNVYLGYCWDFDIPASSYSNDLPGWVDSLELVYMNGNNTPEVYIGGKFLGNTSNIGIHYFTNSTQPETDAAYYALLSNLTIPSTPPSTQDDYKVLSNIGPFTLNAGDTIIISYGVVAGVDLSSLINATVRMEELYDSSSLFVEENQINIPSLNIFNLTPNPSKGQTECFFTLQDNSNVSLKVFDLQGRVVWNQEYNSTMGSNTITIDLTGLNSGVYFVNFRSEEFSESKILTLIK